MENELFSRAVHRSAHEPNAALDLARDCTRMNAFLVRAQVLNAFHFALQLFFCKRRENSFSILANSNTNFFFTNSKLRVHYTRIKFYFSRVCRLHKNFQLFIKLLLKISFFTKLFCFLWFTQNYRYFSTIYKIFTQLSPTEFYLCIF